MSDMKFTVGLDLSGYHAGISQAQAAVSKATGAMQQTMAGVKTATQEATATATSGFGAMAAKLGTLAAAYIGLQSVQALARISDDAALATARINGLTGSMEVTRQAQAQLFEMSQRLQAGYSEAVSSFARMLPAVKELGGGVGETTKLTEILLTTAKLSGASAGEAAASAQQFAQALASGTLAGDELKSILENNSTLARTLATGLGVSIGELRKMGEEGKLTSDKVGNVLLKSYDDIKAKAGELPSTVGGAWTQITNAFTRLVSTTADGTGVFAGLSAVMTEVAKVIQVVTSVMTTASAESSKLGENEGGVTFAQRIGQAFAYMYDLVSAIVTSIGQSIRALIELFAATGNQIGAVAAAAVAAAHGDFAGAADIIQDSVRRSARAVEGLGVAWGENAARTMAALTGNGQALAAYNRQLEESARKAKPGGSDGGDAVLQGAPAGSTEPTAAERAAAERAAANRAIREAERAAAEQQRILEKQLAAEREAAAIRMDMAQMRAIAEVDSEQRIARAKVDAGEMTHAQLLEAELGFEQRRYEIRAQAAQQALELARLEGRDPAEVERINQELLGLELAYQAQRQQIGLQMQQATGGKNSLASIWTDSQQAMQRAVQGMLAGTQSLRQGMVSAWQNIRASIIGEIGKILVAKVAAFAKEKLLALAGITASAAEGGANSFKAMSGIPIIGPALGAAAMAASFAAIIGMQGKISSAAGGYDIPAGLNPVTQLHAREMVLPAEHAETIRQLSAQGGGAGPVKFELGGMSEGEFFIANRRLLARALEQASREFAFTGKRF